MDIYDFDTYIFDFDGVIVDSEYYHYLSYKNLNYQDFIKRLYKKASILNSERFINKI